MKAIQFAVTGGPEVLRTGQPVLGKLVLKP